MAPLAAMCAVVATPFALLMLIGFGIEADPLWITRFWNLALNFR